MSRTTTARPVRATPIASRRTACRRKPEERNRRVAPRRRGVASAPAGRVAHRKDHFRVRVPGDADGDDDTAQRAETTTTRPRRVSVVKGGTRPAGQQRRFGCGRGGSSRALARRERLASRALERRAR
jgi:hypothetical protein